MDTNKNQKPAHAYPLMFIKPKADDVPQEQYEAELLAAICKSYRRNPNVHEIQRLTNTYGAAWLPYFVEYMNMD